MKTSLVIAAIIVVHKISKTMGKEKFDCPVECPPNVYRPVCSRGKSYVNLCVLQQEICKGKTAREVYNDVENCPGYKKDEDASGKSVEAVDKNGVIFRHLIDPPVRRKPASTKAPKRLNSKLRPRLKMSDNSQIQEDPKREQPKTPCPASCSILFENDFAQRCPLQYLFCRSFTPTVSINFVENCRKPREELNPSGRHVSSIETSKRLFDFANRFKRSADPRPRRPYRDSVDAVYAQRFCQFDCDPSVNEPLCSGSHYFRNACYLRRDVCYGKVGKDIAVGAKRCPF